MALVVLNFIEKEMLQNSGRDTSFLHNEQYLSPGELLPHLQEGTAHYMYNVKIDEVLCLPTEILLSESVDFQSVVTQKLDIEEIFHEIKERQ